MSLGLSAPMALKRWILLAGALCSFGSQACAGEFTEADLTSDQIVFAKSVLANCKKQLPEVKSFKDDTRMKIDAGKSDEIDVEWQARIVKKLLAPFPNIDKHSYGESLKAVIWFDATNGCFYPNAIKFTYIYKNLE